MGNAKQYLLFNQGKDKWNAWRKANPGIQPDLSGYDFTFIKSSMREYSKPGLNTANNGNLMRRGVMGYDLSNTNLSSCKFWDAVFHQTNLNGANLQNADFRQALIAESDLRNTDLRGAVFILTLFQTVQLEGARFGQSHLAFSPFKNCSGLENVLHSAPSQMDMLSFVHSDPLSKDFAQQFNIDAHYYEKYSQLDPQQFFDCFISHSSKDKAFVHILWAALMLCKVPTWYSFMDYRLNTLWYNKNIDPHDLGRDLYNMVDAADVLILALSNNSLQSQWVAEEVRRARKKIILPVIIETLDPQVIEKTAWYPTLPEFRIDFRKFDDTYEGKIPLALLLYNVKKQRQA